MFIVVVFFVCVCLFVSIVYLGRAGFETDRHIKRKKEKERKTFKITASSAPLSSTLVRRWTQWPSVDAAVFAPVN